MFCPNCGTKLDDDAKFCRKCGASLGGSGGADDDASGLARGHYSPKASKPLRRFSVAKIVAACAICVAMVGGIALAVSIAGKGGSIDPSGQSLGEVDNGQVESDSLGDASLIVYGSRGIQIGEFDVTLVGEDGESEAYHVDNVWDGFYLSSLGVEDGTYDVIVTDKHSGNSATVDNVVVSVGSVGSTTYIVGTEDTSRSEEAWSYMDTATNKLAAANLFWQECQELQEEHGHPSTFTDTEFGFVYPTGLCFVNLLDVNEDGEDELVVCYIDQYILEENIANRSPYGSTIKDPGWIRVLRYNHQYRDLSSGLQIGTGISAGMGAIGFTHNVPTGVGLVACDLNRGAYVRYDLTGEGFESKEYSNSGTYGYLRDGEEVGPTEAAQGIQDLLSHCTMYLLCGDVDSSNPAEVLPYSEVERVTAETLDYLSRADQILFKNPK